MSLKKVTLRNFRTCHDVELNDLEHLTVLMGRNGVGKTNILQGIEWIGRTASSSEKVDIETLCWSDNLFSTFDGNPFQMELVLNLNDTTYRYIIEINDYKRDSYSDSSLLDKFNLLEKLEKSNDCGLWNILIERINEEVMNKDEEIIATIHQYTPMLPAISALMPKNEINEDISSILKFFKNIRYYSLDESAVKSDDPFEITTRSDYKNWLVKSNNKNKREDSITLRILDMYIKRKDDFNELNAILGENGLCVLTNIYIDTFDLEGMNNNDDSIKTTKEENIHYRLRFRPGQGWNGAKVVPSLPYGKLSYGTQRLLRILVSFFYDNNSVNLIEQPEDAIHPGLLRKLIGLLRSYDDRGQLIMASHSSDLFDVLKPEEVRLVTMQGGATKLRGLTEPELASAKRFINEEGNLSDYLDLLETD